MKVRALVLTLFLAVCFSATAQVDSFEEAIMTYLSKNGTQKQYDKGYDEMFVMLKQHFATADVPDSFWTKLQNNRDESIGDITKMLSFAYRKHFTESDIKLMTQFYETEAGKQLAIDATALTKEQSAEVISYQQSSVGQKVSAAQGGLTKDIETISRDWSRELYMEKMGALVKNGYKPKKAGAKTTTKKAAPKKPTAAQLEAVKVNN